MSLGEATVPSPRATATAAALHQIARLPGLWLRRVWPHRDGRLLLEYEGDGGVVAGQWAADPARLALAAAAVPGSSVVDAGSTQVLLQPDGADRRLATLAPLLREPGTRLISHRPERRAVVRRDGTGGTEYLKVVSRRRAAALRASAELTRGLGRTAFRVPELRWSDEPRGTFAFSPLGGLTLQDLLGDDARCVGAATATAGALRALHATPPPPALSATHGIADELAQLDSWLARIAPHAHELAADIAWAAAPVKARAQRIPPPSPVLVHADFHDKQVLLEADDRVGVVDLDSVAIGDPGTDLANLLVHIRLRTLERRCTTAQADAALAAILDTYRPSPALAAQLTDYADVIRLRLACTYALRPGRPLVSRMLLGEVGSPLAR